jgi:mono/diheme cytochrome c family protein
LNINFKPRSNKLLAAGWLILCVGSTAGCAQNMRQGSKLEPYEESSFFDDGRSARDLVPNTVARGQLRTDTAYYTGRSEAAAEGTAQAGETAQAEGTAQAEATTQASGQASAQGRASYVEEFPVEISRELIERGRDRYNVYCAPCHGLSGHADGMIVARGFKTPPSFHQDRLRDAPVGYFFDVITNGFGTMFPYGSRIDVPDRWAIIAYIRALQLSQNAALEDVPADERQKLEDAGQ